MRHILAIVSSLDYASHLRHVLHISTPVRGYGNLFNVKKKSPKLII